MKPYTTENEWLVYLKKTPQWHPTFSKTIILSPHPDDETLGLGGLIADLRSKNIDVKVVAITDGENAYSGICNLGKLRTQEQEQALSLLGVPKEKILRLHLSDSALEEKELTTVLKPWIENHYYLLAPWVEDFHPDHKIVGKVATDIAKQLGLSLSYYFFWTWHRSVLSDIKHLPLQRYPLSDSAYKAKQMALSCYRSQLKQADRPPILTNDLLAPARRLFEVFLPL